MRSNFRGREFVIAFVVVAACALDAAAQGAEARAADDAAVRESVRQMEAGWNAKSGALFAKPFTEDADYVVVNGKHVRGREAINKGHQGIFDTVHKNTTLGLTVKQVRYLRADVAIVHVHSRLRTPEGEGERAHESFISLVMSKEKDGWKIAAFQNTPLAEGPRQ